MKTSGSLDLASRWKFAQPWYRKQSLIVQVIYLFVCVYLFLNLLVSRGVKSTQMHVIQNIKINMEGKNEAKKD